MLIAPFPPDEDVRLAGLRDLAILDTPPEERFDRITRVARQVFDVPIALVSLVDAERQWFKSCQGFGVSETPRDISFCGHAILSADPLIIPDAREDPRFADNPLVIGDPYIRFYAGQPLAGPRGERVGTLCIIDRRPRHLSEADLRTLRDLAGWVENELNARDLSQALAAQEALFRTSLDGILLTIPDGTILDANPAACRLLGRTRDEILAIGRSGLADPTDPGLATMIAERRRTGSFHGEIRLRRPDGTSFPVEISTTTYRDRQDQERASIILRDVTARKKAEADLAATYAASEAARDELERQYEQAELARAEARAVLDATSEAILLFSPEGRVMAANRQVTDLFGVPLDQVLDRAFEDLREPIERVFADPLGFRLRLGETALDSRREFREIVAQKWPARRELELTSVPVWTEAAPVAAYLGRLYAFRDVTREREADRLKSEFVSLVSHELRTPLTSIKGFVDLVASGDAGDLNADQREFLGIAARNIDRLGHLIADFLDLTRIESGKVRLDLVDLDLAGLIRQTTASLRPQIDAKSQSLTLALDPAPQVRGDAGKLTQVLTNLLSNAHKFTPAGGEIAVTLCLVDAGVRVEVADTGIGMSPEELAQLFTKFYRARNAATAEIAGTGLGLSIVKSLVELHGGTIAVTSAPGRGSTFSVVLPPAGRSAAIGVEAPEPVEAADRCRV